jgi:hypothetical protein
MKQTAVEWYCEKSVALSEDLRTGRINFIEWFKEQADILKQAKDMEKQQHKQTWFDSIAQFDNAAKMTYKKDFEQYYNNKTFKSE